MSRPKLIALLAVVAVLVLVADGYEIMQANRAKPVTLDAALQKFRAESPGAVGAPAATAVSIAPGVSAPTGGGGPATTAAPLIKPVAKVPAPATAQPNAAKTAVSQYGLPAAGVYAYRTTGGEQLNVPGSARSYPSVTYATVTHQGGCQWLIENDVIQQHTDKRRVCSSQGTIAQLDQSRTISFFGQTESYEYVCQPPLPLALPTDAAGTTRTGTCTDAHGDGSIITANVAGREQVTVGGTPVEVEHVICNSKLTGAVTGSSVDELLIDVHTGMIVSWHRTVNSYANAFGVNAHYTEHATFDLESLVPQT